MSNVKSPEGPSWPCIVAEELGTDEDCASTFSPNNPCHIEISKKHLISRIRTLNLRPLNLEQCH